MPDRKDYFKEYNKKRRVKQLTYFREKYQRNKKERLQYARKRYILKREAILLTLKKQSIEFVGHAHSIWKAVKKYAKEWKLPCADWDEFKAWTIDDVGYEEQFKLWKENNFDARFTPVVMRGIKKNGFVVGNLKWDIKNNYSWWNEDRSFLNLLQAEVSKKQLTANEGTKEETDIIRKQLKKRKLKK